MATSGADEAGRKAAYAAIKAMYSAHQHHSEGDAGGIYEVALLASKSRSPNVARACFLEWISYGESRLKREKKITNLKRAIGQKWSVYKSNIVRGFRHNIRPEDYRNEYEYREAVKRIAGSAPDDHSEAELRKHRVLIEVIQRMAAEVAPAEHDRAQQIVNDAMRDIDSRYKDIIDKLAKLL